jgi:hypothetical protein
MIRTLQIAVLLAATLLTNAQAQSAADEIASLKKQVTSLKQVNAKLEQTIVSLKKEITGVKDNVNSQLKDFDEKMKAVSDSVKTKQAVIDRCNSRIGQIFHSLDRRKTAFYAIFVVALLLVTLIFLLVARRFKLVIKHSEVRVSNVKDTLETEIHKVKEDLLTQISELRSELVKTKEDLKKQMEK